MPVSVHRLVVRRNGLGSSATQLMRAVRPLNGPSGIGDPVRGYQVGVEGLDDTMAKNWMQVRQTTYELAVPHLRVSIEVEDGESFVTFDIFLDSKELSRPGIAINRMSFRGSDVAQLENSLFELTDERGDEINELRESVIVEPGSQLELSSLKVQFGDLKGRHVPVELQAVCYRVDEETYDVSEENIQVVAHLECKLLGS